MNPFFKNINIFLAQNIHFFSTKTLENGIDFTRIPEFFRKIKLKFSIFMMHINPEKVSVDSIITLRKLFEKITIFRQNFSVFWKFSMKDLLFFFENFKLFTRIFGENLEKSLEKLII